jgi:hypothetical protein
MVEEHDIASFSPSLRGVKHNAIKLWLGSLAKVFGDDLSW